jgi:hypothetical protein
VTDVEVRKPVPLRTVPGIELAAVGTWKASTGITTFTQEDLLDAVAALECPGVRNPVLKLGHDEEDSTSGVRWDGEPAVGWVANMRFDGTKLIGDYTGVPAWLADADENGLSVLAAAYPDRSIEIYRPFVCQIGHTHPSVIQAVALLGVYAPGVGVLKSMQDVYAAWTTTLQETDTKASAMSHNGPILNTFVTLAAAPERREPTEIEKRSGVDFARVAEQHAAALGTLLDDWSDISAAQRDELAAQIADAVDNGPDTLGALVVDSAAAATLLVSSMTGVAEQAAREQVAEAKRQGVALEMPDITEDTVRDAAEAVTAAMAASTASTAGRTAAQALGTGDGKHVATTTLDYLAGLSDRFLRDELGGALSTAQARGRYAALYGYEGPVDLYASEINDSNACAPCRSIDGARFESLDQAQTQYGAGKYSGCLGGARCRGQLIAVFGSGRASVSTTIRTTLGGRMAAVKASVSVEDISRRYYEAAGYSMWIAEMQVDPLVLIAADDSTGKHFRIPVELSGEEFTFGEPQEVAVSYVDVKAAAAAPVQWGDRKAALAAAGKNEDGSDRIAPDVSPAGAAIRKAKEKAEANAPAVLETEVEKTEETTETPAADPATGPNTTPKEASVDALKMREALGLGPDATDDEVAKAFSAQVAAASAPVTPPSADNIDAMALLAGSGQAVLVDKAQLSTLIETARKGEIAYNQNRRNERDAFLSAAVREGRIPPASLKAYENLWDNDPEGTRKTVSLLSKNIIPVSASGFAGQETDLGEVDQILAAVYGKDAA